MRFVALLLIIGLFSLEVASQQLPEGIIVNTEELRVSQELITTLKILQGDQTTNQDILSTTGILGTITKDKQTTTFKPLVPFNTNTSYTLLLNNEAFVFNIQPEIDTPAFQVSGIYPNTKEVPANVLKWYIRFSKPVNPVKIYDHITFLDEVGNPINRSILNLGAALLSQDGTLLTVWVEPGRQKQLLGPNLELGSVFTPHTKYSLHIANTLKDKQGKALVQSITHQFKTTRPDKKKPSLEEWEIIKPQANLRNALRIKTKDNLDYGSFLDAFSIHYKGEITEGTLTWDSTKKLIEFMPIKIWNKGSYTIHLKETLEDVAGNNLVHLFDRPLNETPQETPLKELVFTVD